MSGNLIDKMGKVGEHVRRGVREGLVLAARAMLLAGGDRPMFLLLAQYEAERAWSAAQQQHDQAMQKLRDSVGGKAPK